VHIRAAWSVDSFSNCTWKGERKILNWFNPLTFYSAQVAAKLEQHSNLLNPASLLNSLLGHRTGTFYQEQTLVEACAVTW